MEFTQTLDAPTDTRPHVGTEPDQNALMQENIFLRSECARMRNLHYEIYEIYAGSEGFWSKTSTEQYLSEMILRMADLAAEGKSLKIEVQL